jgi:NTE family protein
MAPPFLLPDVLVLGGGGTLGEAWMNGILAGISTAADVDFRRCEHFVGTSAGSIVAARLAAGRELRLPPEEAEELEEALAERGRLATAALALAGRGLSVAAAPLAPLAMRAGAPLGALLRSVVLARAPGLRGDLDGMAERIDRRGARFDGRLRITAVDRRSGRRVIFGAPGAPAATVGQAVQASCAIPGIFRPVPIDGREYVDGGAWSPTNLDAAPAGRGTQVLCLTVAGRVDRASGRMMALQLFTRTSLTVEELAVRSRGASVQTIVPDRPALRALGENLMDRSRAAQALAEGFRQGLAVGRGS